MDLQALAKDVAIEAKLFNVTDGEFGFLYEDEWNLTDAEWMTVCALVEDMLPTVEPTKEQWIFHSEALRGWSATDPIYSDF